MKVRTVVKRAKPVTQAASPASPHPNPLPQGEGVAKPKLALAVQYATKPEGAPTRHQFKKWTLAALKTDAEITLRIVGTAEGQALNRDYRGKDYATNVLTFPLNKNPLMGDIVLCASVVSAEAIEQGKTLDAHYAHLTVHGVLHLQGYDHENDDDAETMEALETQIVTDLGYPAPYLVLENAAAHG